MSEAFLLALDLPSTVLRRRWLRSEGKQPGSSSAAVLPCCSDPNLGNLLCFSSFRCKMVAVDSTSSGWSVDEEALPREALTREAQGDNQSLSYEDVAPASMNLETITGKEQFDQIIAEAQQVEMPVVVVWIANWCRKCIYLKPKLEKLATDYHPRIRFYYVDVNAVPHKLVQHAGVTKMPTIQLWKDSTKQAEVIGGHKAWLVIGDIRQMIEEAS